MLNSIKVLLLVSTLRVVQSETKSIHNFDSIELNSDGCLKGQNDYNLQKSQINLYESLDCQLPNSSEVGIIKFLFECPALKTNAPELKTHKLCRHEICSDLVCCPAFTTKTRLKNVCWDVDHPRPLLDARFYTHPPCTVRGLNLTGFYQQKCDFADRHPHLKNILKNNCDEIFLSDDWYCCPIEDDDTVYCKSWELYIRNPAKSVGPKCIDSKTGRNGRCSRSSQIYAAEKTEEDLDSCGTFCEIPLWCLPDSDTNTSVIRPKSKRECNSFSQYFIRQEIEVTMDNITKNVERYAFIPAFGTKVKPGDYPHMAALGYEDGQQLEFKCGGSLISDQYVLTAAHCLTNSMFGSVKKVRLGVVNLLNDINTYDCPEDFNVARIIPHPEYLSNYVYNDIGLIELADRATFNFYIRAICLPSDSNLPDHSWLNSMGWGALGPTEERTVNLVQVYQQVFTYDECQEYYINNKNRKQNETGISKDTQICAGSKTTKQSTCDGDSGGPLQDGGIIFGVVSFGTICGFTDNPGVYTKVFPYVPWIEGIVWN